VVKFENYADQILDKVKTLQEKEGLILPKDYLVTNALKSAWLQIMQTEDKDKKPALVVCSKESIQTSLLDLVLQGLSTVKKQAYFIVFGGKLTLLRSYFGTIAVAKRVSDVIDARAFLIYEGDDFQYELDTDKFNFTITKHQSKFENIRDDKIIGGYCAVFLSDGRVIIAEPMTIAQIKAAWQQGATKGSSPAHQKFAGEMAKKSIINRALKTYINASTDNSVVMEAFNRTSANEYEDTDYEDMTAREIKDNANKQILDINPVPEKVQEEPKVVQEEPKVQEGKKPEKEVKKEKTLKMQPHPLPEKKAEAAPDDDDVVESPSIFDNPSWAEEVK
jgi:recombination protein RecT